MSNKLNNKELADLLALKAQISESEAEMFLKELFKLVAETISETEVVKIKDFGTFKLIRVQARESVDVNTGEKIEIPSHLKVNFLPAPTLKDLVNKPFSHFETTLLNGDTSFSEVAESEEKENDNDNEEEDTALDNTDISEYIVSSEPINSDIVINTEEIIEAVRSIDSSDHVDTTNHDVSTETIKSDNVLKTDEIKKNLILTDNSNKASLKSKRKKTEIWIPILGAVVVIGALIFFYTQGNRKNTQIKSELHDSSVNQITPEPDPIATNEDTTEYTNIIHTTPTPDITETVKLEAGKTLRLIALDKYGSRDFWIYIYLANKDKIKNPDVIPVGTELILPDTLEFDINSKDPASVSKAKKLGDITMKNLSNN